ncbi:MAG: enterotoxin, partial [Candidatus Baltobacteraceae bacterium]
MKRREFVVQTAAGTSALLLPFAAQTARAQSGAPAFIETGNTFAFGNQSIGATFHIAQNHLAMVGLWDRVNGERIPLPGDLFSIALKDGTQYACGEFTVTSGPAATPLSVQPDSARRSSRIPGAQISVKLAHPSGALRVVWRAILRDGSHYLRQEIELEAIGKELALQSVTLLDFPFLPGAFTVGSTDGSPVVSGTLFLGVEHPLAQSDAIYDRASVRLPRNVPLRPGVPLSVSSVIGVTRAGALRRDFSTYVERERAHPYRPFLHYNSWYDIGYFTRYDQAQCLDRIHAFGTELHDKRGVTLSSFLFDDGWDDPSNLWSFNASFPDGFAALKTAAAAYGAAPGAWLSPWGGYGKPRADRLASAKALGYEINDDGLALSGPKYYKLFEDVVMGFITRGGVNQFKLDGTGNSNRFYPGSQFGSDFEAAIHLIETARAAEPSIYVNLTTGTYPSPFWLQFCDSIWRGGEDHAFFGPGSQRQRWMTYRDADTYNGVVTQGPLYPLNSLMLHGLIYAEHAKHLGDDPQDDFRSEVRSYFGTGTQLQELYCTPALLSKGNWDDIAAAAKWSAANADVLCDTRWVGGDPYRLDVYG